VPPPLSDTQRAVLAAVCDALLPDSAAAGTPARAERLIDALQDPLDRTRLAALLAALAWQIVNIVLSGTTAKLSRRWRDGRE